MSATKERIEYYQEKLKDFEGEGYVPTYAAEVEQVDLSVGRVMDHLKELGIDKNTLVIFTSDNGGLARLTNNAPLRAGKGTFYEGGIRVPFCVRWPEVVRAGSRSDYAAIGIDLMPTFAELSGAALPTSQPVDGTSFLGILKEEQQDRDRDLFLHFPLYLEGSGAKEQVLPVYSTDNYFWRAVPSTTLLRGNWKLIYYYEYETYELFNLKEDLGETQDVASKNPELVQDMLQAIDKWTGDTAAPVPDILNEKLTGRELQDEILFSLFFDSFGGTRIL